MIRRLLCCSALLARGSAALRVDARGLRMQAKADLRYVAPAPSDAADQVGNPVAFPRTLYPELEAHQSGMLDVGDGHELYFDVSGNPSIHTRARTLD